MLSHHPAVPIPLLSLPSHWFNKATCEVYAIPIEVYSLTPNNSGEKHMGFHVNVGVSRNRVCFMCPK